MPTFLWNETGSATNEAVPRVRALLHLTFNHSLERFVRNQNCVSMVPVEKRHKIKDEECE